MNARLTNVTVSASVLVCGGVDTAVKKVVYYIGYAIGCLVSWISRLFTKQV